MYRKRPKIPEGTFVPEMGTSIARFERQDAKTQLALLKLIFDNIHNGVVVTDPDGYVVYFNEPYGQFLGVDSSSQIGKHVTDVIENTRMHIVAKTGKPEINVAQRIRGQDMVVQRIPIKKNGKVIAAYGQVMFKRVSDVNKLARKLSLLESKVKLYEEELRSLRSTRYTFDSIVGTSRALVDLKKDALKAARTDFPILITGESGTGKEMFAQAIHGESLRSMHPLIRINCAAIPKDLLESELFGYEKGAFTGASPHGKPGKLELGNYGTVFLDEIGDLPLEMQPKLLRVLEEKELEHVGGTSPIRSDFRLITASNQNLEEMVNEGKFRKDLYYRLNVIRLRIPPLRDRREDIMPIAEQLLQVLADNSLSPSVKIESQAEEALVNYDWPGNARELFNILSRAICFTENDGIHIHDLPLILRTQAKLPEGPEPSLHNVKHYAEKEAILSALAAANNNKTEAAALLGIHRTLIYKKLKRYDITT
jgi:PAS domain S-box-containing protein